MQLFAERNAELSQILGVRRRELAEAITERHYELQPDLAVRYGAAGRAKCLQDAELHLSYMADAASVDLPSLFADYPFNLASDLWRVVGADAWGRDALESVVVADRLLRVGAGVPS